MSKILIAPPGLFEDDGNKPPAHGYGITPGTGLEVGLAFYTGFVEGAGSRAGDLTGNGNHGALTGGATWVGSEMGSVVDLAGDDDDVQVTAPRLLAGSSSFWVAAWVYARATPAWASIVKSWPQSGVSAGTADIHLGMQNIDDDVSIFIFPSGGQAGPVREGVNLPLNQWHHIVATGDGSTLRLYRNGQEVGTSLQYTGTFQGNIDVHIGSRTGVDQFWNGKIGPVSTGTRALSASEIVQLYVDRFILERPPSNVAPFVTEVGAPPAAGFARGKVNASLAHGGGKLVA